MKYDEHLAPLTDAERQQLNVIRQHLNYCAKTHMPHGMSPTKIDYAQELMMRDWLNRKADKARRRTIKEMRALNVEHHSFTGSNPDTKRSA